MSSHFAISLLKCFGQSLFLACAAYLATRFGLKRRGPVDFFIAMGTLFIFGVTAITAVLARTGYLDFASMLMCAVVVFLVAVMGFINQVMAAKGPSISFFGTREKADISWVILPLSIALCSAALVVSLNFPPSNYDVMTYHLFFPARWVQEGQFFHIPSVFGDPAPTYSPSNAELTFAFWSLPFVGDTLSRSGQFPFLVLGAAAVFGFSRRRGMTAGASSVAVCLAVLSPVLFRQGFSAEADLAMGAGFVTALYFLDRYRERPNWADALLFGLSFGFCIGTKYVALTYCTLLVVPFLIFLVRGIDPEPGKRLAHLAVFSMACLCAGGFWYLKNWIVTGNPLFPLDLSPVFEGAYSRAAMMKSPFHVPNLHFVFIVWLWTYGPITAIVAIFGLISGVVLIATGRVKGFQAYSMLLPILLAIIHFVLVPYNSQYRFLIPAVFLSYLSLADLESINRAKWPSRIVWGALLAVTVLGTGRNINLGFLREAIPGMGLVPRAYVAYILLPLAVSFPVFFLLWNLRVAPLYRAIATFAIVTAALLFIKPAFFGLETRQFVAVRPQLSDDFPKSAWMFVQKNISPARIAYCGNNVPYYLLGRAWQNSVQYINPAGPLDYNLHDFIRECSMTSSCPAKDETDKPTFFYRTPDRSTWLKNITDARIDYVFLTPLHSMEARYIEHDAEGYPPERQWADESEKMFKLIYSDSKARIYRVFQTEPGTEGQ